MLAMLEYEVSRTVLRVLSSYISSQLLLKWEGEKGGERKSSFDR